MAGKMLEILEGLRELGYPFAWVYGDLQGWQIKVLVPPKEDRAYSYPVDPGIVSPYRTVESVVREIVEEVKRYGKG